MNTDGSDGQGEIENQEPHIMYLTFDFQTIPDAIMTKKI